MFCEACPPSGFVATAANSHMRLCWHAYALALENERRRLRRFDAHRKDTSVCSRHPCTAQHIFQAMLPALPDSALILVEVRPSYPRSRPQRGVLETIISRYTGTNSLTAMRWPVLWII